MNIHLTWRISEKKHELCVTWRVGIWADRWLSMLHISEYLSRSMDIRITKQIFEQNYYAFLLNTANIWEGVSSDSLIAFMFKCAVLYFVYLEYTVLSVIIASTWIVPGRSQNCPSREFTCDNQPNNLVDSYSDRYPDVQPDTPDECIVQRSNKYLTVYLSVYSMCMHI